MSDLFTYPEPAKPEPTTADAVRECLTLRWPDGDYLHIAEAPQDSSRMGRKIDVLVVALWQSRGLERDAVEIKVSLSDWKREQGMAEKADFWWRHSHRFWVAVPASLAPKIRDDLPPGWGLLACTVGYPPKIVVKPAKREAEPLSWFCTVGVLRACADAGRNALFRAEQRGEQRGVERGKREAERGTSDDALRRLREDVKAFEEASGVCIRDTGFRDVRHLGGLVALVRREIYSPGWLADSVSRAAEDAIRAADSLKKEAKSAQEKAITVSAVLREATTPQEAAA